MEKPNGCSMELYSIMRACWAHQQCHRPAFSVLVSRLDAMLAAGRDYLDLGPAAVENPQYMEDTGPQWRFGPVEGYDQPRKNCACPPGTCHHHPPIPRYENEQPIDNNIDDHQQNLLQQKTSSKTVTQF